MTGSSDSITIECTKRVFWTAYTLDSYLSSSLGRPKALNDDDIDQVSLPGIDNSLCVIFERPSLIEMI